MAIMATSLPNLTLCVSRLMRRVESQVGGGQPYSQLTALFHGSFWMTATEKDFILKLARVLFAKCLDRQIPLVSPYAFGDYYLGDNYWINCRIEKTGAGREIIVFDFGLGEKYGARCYMRISDETLAVFEKDTKLFPDAGSVTKGDVYGRGTGTKDTGDKIADCKSHWSALLRSSSKRNKMQEVYGVDISAEEAEKTMKDIYIAKAEAKGYMEDIYLNKDDPNTKVKIYPPPECTNGETKQEDGWNWKCTNGKWVETTEMSKEEKEAEAEAAARESLLLAGLVPTLPVEEKWYKKKVLGMPLIALLAIAGVGLTAIMLLVRKPKRE